MENIYEGFTFVTRLSLNDTKGFYTVGKGKGDYKANFYGLKKGEGIDFPKLLNYLKFGQKGTLCYWRFKGTPTKERDVVISYGVVETGRILNSTVAFTYKNEYKQKIETGIRCAINTKEDYVLNVPHFSMDLDFNKKNSVGRIVYFFAGTEDYRKEALSTSDKTDFTINEKYVAINFFSENLNDMAFLAKELYGDAEWYKNLVNAQYLPLLENAKYAEELIWLYENAADFTLAALKPEALWKHICTFYKYDTVGKFSFLKDASKQLMRTLFAFNTPEKIKYLMAQLVKNQLFVKKIYDALDGTMVFNGKEQKCQTIFASIITGFCFTDTSTLNFTNEIFSVGKDYYVNVKDVGSNDKEQEKYLVEQVLRTEDPYTDNNGTTHYDDAYILESSIKLNPLDIVTVLQKDTDSLIFVPVLFLKDQDHQKDIENLLTAVRIGVDMLAIGLTVATLGGASPLLAVAGALEIAIVATDIAVMTNKDQLSEEFLKTWEKIYIIGGIATASPSVVSSLYKLGGKILASSVKEEMKNYVRSCMMKMILEKEMISFEKNTISFFKNESDLIISSGGVLNERKIHKLFEQGAIAIKGEVKTGNKAEEQIAIIYKGEIIAKANSRSFFNETYSSIMKYIDSPTQLEQALERIINRRKLVTMMDDSKLGLAPTSGVKMSLRLMDEFGNKAGTIVRKPDGKDLFYTFVTTEGKEVDIKCMLSLLDDSASLRDLPIKNGEFLLYGDFNIPKEITDKLSGLGQVIYEDGLQYYLKRPKKYGKVDGTISSWIKADAYADYGGQSINLEQFWKYKDMGYSTERAAFKTFAGKMAKKNGFTKVRDNIIKKNFVEREQVVINFLK